MTNPLLSLICITPVYKFSPFFQVKVRVNGEEVIHEEVSKLRAVWEETSFQLERLQANPSFVSQEEAGLIQRMGPTYQLTFNPSEKLPLQAAAGKCRGNIHPSSSVCMVYKSRYLHRLPPASGCCGAGGGQQW